MGNIIAKNFGQRNLEPNDYTNIKELNYPLIVITFLLAIFWIVVFSHVISYVKTTGVFDGISTYNASKISGNITNINIPTKKMNDFKKLLINPSENGNLPKVILIRKEILESLRK